MTHAELVKHAEKWLRNKGCGVVITELTTRAWETPDAIGFKDGYSILVECKASRSDFLTDSKKVFRQMSEIGMGTFRFYMCPENLIRADELPEKWGLLWIGDNGKVKSVVAPKGNIWSNQPEYQFEKSMDNEQYLLVSALRRLQALQSPETRPD